MSIHHVVRCEAEGCRTEAALLSDRSAAERAIVQQSGTTRPPSIVPTTVPGGWIRAQDGDFCSWDCVAAFAESMKAKGGTTRLPDDQVDMLGAPIMQANGIG